MAMAIKGILKPYIRPGWPVPRGWTGGSDDPTAAPRPKKTVVFLLETDVVVPPPLTQMPRLTRMSFTPPPPPASPEESEGSFSEEEGAAGPDPRFAVAAPVSFTRTIEKYQLLRVVSPFEFTFIHLADKKSCFTLGGGYLKLQDVARELKLMEDKRPEKLAKNKIYVAFDKRSEMWHRCRLLSFDEKTGQGTVFYFDYYLQAEPVALKDLREVPEVMVKYPVVPTMRGHLYDVIPKNGGYKWGEEIASWFDNQIWHKVWDETGKWNERRHYVGLQMSWHEKRVGSGDGSDLLADVGLVLFEDTEQVWEGTSLNWRIIQRGYGNSIGLGGTYFSSLFFPDVEPAFGMDGPTKEFRVPNWCGYPFPYYTGSRLPQIRFRHLVGPDCIYVYLVNKMEDLKTMEDYIAKFKDSEPLKRNEVKVNTAVIITRRSVATGEISFARGFVLEIEEEKVKALLVDYGKMITASITEIYRMDQRLVKIPAFVHRVHLTNLRPESVPGIDFLSWPQGHRDKLDAILEDIFRKWKPAVFAVRSSPYSNQNVIRVRKFYQPLDYNESQGTWVSSKLDSWTEYNFHEYPLIESHFYSFGVDLQFLRSGSVEADEAVDANGNGKDELWKLESLSELIAGNSDQFAAHLVPQERFDKKGYYDELRKKYNI